MAFKNIKGNTRNSLLDYFVSGKAVQYHTAEFGSKGTPSSGLTATGGVISDYNTPPGAVYRAHIFTSSGTFNVTALSTDPGLPDTVEYLVVGGGGGGGGDSQAGGGGAGGFRTNLAGHPKESVSYPVTVQSYVVTVGAGGVGGTQATGEGRRATNGGNSEFYPPAHTSYPAPQFVRGAGGGGGLGYAAVPNDCLPGGSGGGTFNQSGGTGAAGASIIDSNHPIAQGNAGGDSPEYSSPYAGGGGGGAGRAGAPDSPSTPLGRSTGGYGLQCLIAGSPSNPQPVGAPGPGSGASATGYFAGGGGGGGYQSAGAAGGYGGGGNGGGYGGATPVDGGDGTVTSGGGGGGARNGSVRGGRGGSGVVVFRYQIGQLTATQKATGGAISFYDSGSGLKTIHTFTTSGTFATLPNWSATDVEYVIAAGGGGGGGNHAGGGGAGGYRTGTIPIGAHPVSTTIQVGAGGVGGVDSTVGSKGTPSYFGTPITSEGGGFGTTDEGPGTAVASPGGSGGGGHRQGGQGLGNDPPTLPSQGNPGGQVSPGTGSQAGAGGGGAGAPGSNNSGSTGGAGGAGVQVPTTFQNPASSPGPNGGGLGFPGSSGTWWIAGGGGGGEYDPGAPGGGGAGPAASPYAGAGAGGPGPGGNGSSAKENSASGGGGGATQNGDGGAGGSGIVLIAYPS